VDERETGHEPRVAEVHEVLPDVFSQEHALIGYDSGRECADIEVACPLNVFDREFNLSPDDE
jgi:hypothetical protein